jgi:ferric-dicitrate binding protein FerR (iron transport regulator)
MILASGIKVKSGNIWVAYKGNGKKLQIETPSTIVGVLGTQFGVRVEKDGATKVWCTEGKVWVKGISGETTKIITVGEEVKVAATGAISAVEKTVEPPPPPLDSTTLGEEWMKKATPYDSQGK